VESTPQADNSGSDVLLINPAAGAGRAVKVLPSLRKFAQEQCWRVDFWVTQSADDLIAKARRAVVEGHRRIFVLGGDGTFQVLLNALGDCPNVVLGVIPAGGGNDLAALLGLPPDPLRAAALLLRGETSRMDAVRVRTADGREWLYAGGGGVGLDAEAARHASGSFRKLPGRSRYLLSAIRALLDFRPVRARISRQPGEPATLTVTALLVAVLNTPSYGAGLYLAPDAQTDDGHLNMVILEKHSILEILMLLPALWSQGKLHTTRLQRFHVNCVRIETERPCHFHGDGEILGMTPVEISVVPGAFLIARPARARKP
jgi:diacylglycerol kinase (ATP)